MNVQSFHGESHQVQPHVPGRANDPNNNADVVQQLIKFELHESLKKIFPKAVDIFLNRRISEFFRQNRNLDGGRPLTESEMLGRLTEQLLQSDIPEKVGDVASNSAVTVSLPCDPKQVSQLAGVVVLEQSCDVVQSIFQEELFDTLRKIFPLTERSFLLAEIEKVTSSLGNEDRKLEILVERFFQISSIPKEEKVSLRIFDSSAEVPDHPEDVIFPALAPTDANSKFECGCCFVFSSTSLKVVCLQNHAFCQSCIKRYVDFIISGEGSSAFTCMAQGCSAGFAKSQIQCLDPHCLKQLEERQQNENVAKALAMSQTNEKLSQCPSCGFKCLIPDSNKVFDCYNPKCMKESCKLCKKDWEGHFGLPCDQVEVKGESALRTRTEEAMTQAVVRRCQNCDTPFVKEAGCNKMTCRCGFMQCYLCHQPIKDYVSHFCQHVTEIGTCTRCNKCILFENAEKSDQARVETERQLGVEQLVNKGFSVKGKTIFSAGQKRSAETSQPDNQQPKKRRVVFDDN